MIARRRNARTCWSRAACGKSGASGNPRSWGPHAGGGGRQPEPRHPIQPAHLDFLGRILRSHEEERETGVGTERRAGLVGGCPHPLVGIDQRDGQRASHTEGRNVFDQLEERTDGVGIGAPRVDQAVEVVQRLARPGVVHREHAQRVGRGDHRVPRLAVDIVFVERADGRHDGFERRDQLGVGGRDLVRRQARGTHDPHAQGCLAELDDAALAREHVAVRRSEPGVVLDLDRGDARVALVLLRQSQEVLQRHLVRVAVLALVARVRARRSGPCPRAGW